MEIQKIKAAIEHCLTNLIQIMEKEFIPYKQALALKKLGFDEPCFGFYIAGQLMVTTDSVYNSTDISVLKAPTFSQAFRFFREKYNINVSPLKIKNGYTFVIIQDTKEKNACRVTGNTYEEAEVACLRKLIEILKENK